MTPVNAVLVLRSDSTMDFFGMAGEKNVWGSMKGLAFHTKDAKTMTMHLEEVSDKRFSSDWQFVLAGKQLSIW